jgi:hypothetical protein
MNPLTRLLGKVAARAGTASAPLASANDLQAYYLNGFLQAPLVGGRVRDRLLDALRTLHAGDIKPGFRWEEKYPHTRDVRPNAGDYDEALLDVLFDSDVPGLLIRATGQRLSLAHVQLRAVFPGASYMDWHRDTHLYDGRLSGSIPPLQKVIYYPSLGGPSSPRLLVSPGSHRRAMTTEKADLRQIRQNAVVTVESSDERCLLFDTSLLHASIPETDARGSLRVIYAFGHDFQLDAFAGSERLQERYRARVVSG